MKPPPFNLDAAHRSKLFFDALAEQLRAKRLLQIKFPTLAVNDWGVFAHPGLLGNNVDGTTARLTFTLSGLDADVDKAEEELKQAPFYSILARTAMVLHCATCVICPRDFATQNEYKEWLDTYVVCPLQVASKNPKP